MVHLRFVKVGLIPRRFDQLAFARHGSGIERNDDEAK